MFLFKSINESNEVGTLRKYFTLKCTFFLLPESILKVNLPTSGSPQQDSFEMCSAHKGTFLINVWQDKYFL